MKMKYVKLAVLSIFGAAVTLFLDDLRADEIAEAAAEKAAKKVKDESLSEQPVHKNRAQRRAEMKRGR